MKKTPKWAGTALALWTAFNVVACDMPTEPELPEEPAPTIPTDTTTPPSSDLHISGLSDLIPGHVVTIRGSNLDKIEGVVADGDSVDVEVVSETEARFTMPSSSTCDIDGRDTQVVVNGEERFDGDIALQSVLNLEVGQSKKLTVEELECVQLSADSEDYVLSIANLSDERIEERVLRLQTVVPDSDLAAGNFSTGSSMSNIAESMNLHDGHLSSLEEEMAYATTGDGALSEMQPFDDYANARAGDTVRMVNWWVSGGVYQFDRKEDVPYYEAEVLVSTPGSLIIMDSRLTEDEKTSIRNNLPAFQEAAEMADEYTLPAVRAVINPDYEIPTRGAGGKVVTLVTDIPGIAGTPISSDINPGRKWASGMFSMRVSKNFDRYPAHRMASVIIHEAAHLADHSHRLWDVAPSSSGWYMEALAVQVSEMAARMAAGQEHQALADRADDGSIPFSRIARAPAPTAGTHSPYGPAGSSIGATGLGSYDRGARILSFTEQLVSGGHFQPNQATLYQRLQSTATDMSNGTFEELVNSWGIEKIASEAGMTVEELLRSSMMADLTDDLIPAEAAQRYGLHQIENWDHTEDRDRFMYLMQATGKGIESGQEFDEEITVPAGGFAYWYIPGNGEGVSLEAQDLGMKEHHEVTVTRIR